MSSYRKQFISLPKFSFIRGSAGGVQRVADPSGNWIDRYEAAVIVENMDDEINHLTSVIRALKGQGLTAVPPSTNIFQQQFDAVFGKPEQQDPKPCE
jgi:hypothetical protein